MDKKAIEESIKFRHFLKIHLTVPIPQEWQHKDIEFDNIVEALYWMVAHIGMLTSRVENLEKEVKPLKKKGVK